MQPKIHPNFLETTILCACGHTFQTLSNQEKIHVEICSQCHPFYTGKQKFIDIGGRVDRFNKKVDTVAKHKATASEKKPKRVKKALSVEEDDA